MKLKNKIYNRLGLAKYHLDASEFNKAITVFDTSIGTLNVGDEIINYSAQKHLKEIFPCHQFIRLTTHDGISNVGLNRSSICEHRFVCGSNILNSNQLSSQQWNFDLFDFLRIEPLNLMGVGWSNYQFKPSFLTSWIFNNRLDKNHYQSVRDSYTEHMLKQIGIKKIINTSCPTMWELDSEHCLKIPKYKSDNVIFTLTDYRPNIVADTELLVTLKKSYKKLYFWVQGSKDLSYFNKINQKVREDIIIIPPSLHDYDEVLDTVDSIDFVGTRLHAGIRALQKKKRTIIIGVDNRAIEKQKDFNIPVIDRNELIKNLSNQINSDFITNISIPEKNIEKWKAQF